MSGHQRPIRQEDQNALLDETLGSMSEQDWAEVERMAVRCRPGLNKLGIPPELFFTGWCNLTLSARGAGGNRRRRPRPSRS